MTMGERIAALRKGRGMTQEQLAERLSVTRQSVSKWELDQATPEIGYAVALCETFEVSLDYLIRGEELPPPPKPVRSDPMADQPKADPDPTKNSPKPLTIKGYLLLFIASLGIPLEICLNLMPLGAIWHTDEISILFFLLYTAAVPFPALYLTLKHWCYASCREAFRHVWSVTAMIAVPAQLLPIGGYILYSIFFSHSQSRDNFWFTSWETLWYQFLVGEILVLSVLLPLMVRFHKKKWLCVMFYVLSWSSLAAAYVADWIPDLLVRNMGMYWALASIAVRLGMVLIAVASQWMIARFCFPENHPVESSQPQPRCPLGGVVVICSLAILTIGGGLYYGLGLAGLSTAYLPIALLPIPLVYVFIFRGKNQESARAAWKTVGVTLGFYAPLMTLAHVFTCYFSQYLLSFGVMIVPLRWDIYAVASLISALVGGILTIPAMVALRKKPRLCIAVYAVAVAATVAATCLLPVVLY